MSMYAFFRMLGSLSSSLDTATTISGPAFQVIVVYAGYIIPRQSMHPWLYWVPDSDISLIYLALVH
jgi:ATP-binding cassette, subfamily G (WHITE), member 2, PDR